HFAAAVDKDRSRLRTVLDGHAIAEERHCFERHMIERTTAEEIEIDGDAMSESQSERGTTVKDEVARERHELGPQGPLRRRQDIEPCGEGHGSGRCGRGGGGCPKKNRCQKFQDRASMTPGGALRSASRNASSPRTSRASRMSS